MGCPAVPVFPNPDRNCCWSSFPHAVTLRTTMVLAWVNLVWAIVATPILAIIVGGRRVKPSAAQRRERLRQYRGLSSVLRQGVTRVTAWRSIRGAAGSALKALYGEASPSSRVRTSAGLSCASVALALAMSLAQHWQSLPDARVELRRITMGLAPVAVREGSLAIAKAKARHPGFEGQFPEPIYDDRTSESIRRELYFVPAGLVDAIAQSERSDAIALVVLFEGTVVEPGARWLGLGGLLVFSLCLDFVALSIASHLSRRLSAATSTAEWVAAGLLAMVAAIVIGALALTAHGALLVGGTAIYAAIAITPAALVVLALFSLAGLLGAWEAAKKANLYGVGLGVLVAVSGPLLMRGALEIARENGALPHMPRLHGAHSTALYLLAATSVLPLAVVVSSPIIVGAVQGASLAVRLTIQRAVRAILRLNPTVSSLLFVATGFLVNAAMAISTVKDAAPTPASSTRSVTK
jgi:hypothetical protein